MVDEVFLINLEAATDRLKSSMEGLRRNQIHAIKVIPIQSSLMNVEVVRSGWNKNAKSLLETTKSIIDYAKVSGLKRILILEDDVCFNDQQLAEFISDYDKFSNVVKKWDFIHLHHSHGRRFSLRSNNGFRLTLDGVLSCQAYMIDEGVYDEYLKLLENYDKPIDSLVRHIQKTKKNSYVYVSNPVMHEKGKWSFLREKIVDY